MILRNYTPFLPLFFESCDLQDRDFGVLVLRGTFDILPGATLRPNPQQAPIVEADVWHGEPNLSSVYLESDLAPFKPQTDILVNAVAHAPGGRPLPDWNINVRVGPVCKALHVTGPRAWVKEAGRWQLEAPEPVSEVPIRYEHAFGGIWATNWGETHICPENPIGVGFGDDEGMSSADRIQAPQIESPDTPVVEWGKRYRPEGLGPICRSWQPRLGRAGTFDDDWQRSRWPRLPLDFKYSFHSAAHPDLIAPGFLRGDEEIELVSLSSDGTLRSWLPGYRMGTLCRLMDGSMSVAPLVLDTLMLDVPAMRTYITWRSFIPIAKPIRVIEARLAQSNGGHNG